MFHSPRIACTGVKQSEKEGPLQSDCWPGRKSSRTGKHPNPCLEAVYLHQKEALPTGPSTFGFLVSHVCFLSFFPHGRRSNHEDPPSSRRHRRLGAPAFQGEEETTCEKLTAGGRCFPRWEGRLDRDGRLVVSVGVGGFLALASSRGLSNRLLTNDSTKSRNVHGAMQGDQHRYTSCAHQLTVQGGKCPIAVPALGYSCSLVR